MILKQLWIICVRLLSTWFNQANINGLFESINWFHNSSRVFIYRVKALINTVYATCINWQTKLTTGRWTYFHQGLVVTKPELKENVTSIRLPETWLRMNTNIPLSAGCIKQLLCTSIERWWHISVVFQLVCFGSNILMFPQVEILP